MSHEGKLARAMAKAGSGDKLTNAPSDPAAASSVVPQPRVETVADKPSRARVFPIRRVPFSGAQPEYEAVMISDRTSEAASQIRALRAKIIAINNSHPPRTITVTSGTRQEGKTTIAVNLAAALSEIDLGRVLLLDGDVLQPSVARTLHLDVQTGLGEVLSNPDLSFDGCIYETALPNLDVLPTRPIAPSDTPEAALHQNIERLLGNLRRFYSYVIIDTPPVISGSQAVSFAKCSDGAVVVCRLEKTPRHVVKRTIEDLTSVGVRVIGCVLTHHRHHIPNFIYRFFGTPPSHYHRYYHSNGSAHRAGVSESDATAGDQPASQPDGDETREQGK